MGNKNRRSFLNVYIIERLVLSHIFYFNRYNSCLSPCIFVVFITCVIYNLHARRPGTPPAFSFQAQRPPPLMPAPHTVPPERRRKIKEGRLPIPLTAAFAFVLETGVFQTIRSSAPLLMHSYDIYIRLVRGISRYFLILIPAPTAVPPLHP